MTTPRRGWLVGALVAAVVALVASVAAVAGSGSWGSAWNGAGFHGRGMTGGMMGGGFDLPGDGGPVTALPEARERARVFADRLGLQVGEVMQFSNGYYAELVTADGDGATEVLIDPDSGGVGIEYGPAMMWNIEYGMRALGGGATARVSPSQAEQRAQEWLDATRPDLTAGAAEAFPGYYTVHTLRDGRIDGMLSVNDTTGAVWYHTWHGAFIDMSEDGAEDAPEAGE